MSCGVCCVHEHATLLAFQILKVLSNGSGRTPTHQHVLFLLMSNCFATLTHLVVLIGAQLLLEIIALDERVKD
jgi:hypothetical protein